MNIFFKGFNYAQDGPGNRLVYHLQGCNMHCPWCANPEGMSFIGGQNYSIEYLITECLRSCKMFFDGGGVTFTGGEATMQYPELTELLQHLRNHHIHTAIETNGSSLHLLEIADQTDYLIMDFKHYDPDTFLYYTGVPITQLKYNYEHLCRKGHFVHIRIPLINHINTDAPQKFAEYLSSFPTDQCVFEFLPYHEYGKGKWKETYRIKDGFISEQQLQNFKEVFEDYHLKIIHT